MNLQKSSFEIVKKKKKGREGERDLSNERQ